MSDWRAYVICMVLWQAASMSSAQELAPPPPSGAEVRFRETVTNGTPAGVETQRSFVPEATPPKTTTRQQPPAAPIASQPKVKPKLRLPPPSKPIRRPSPSDTKPGSTGSLFGVISSLAIVVGLFFTVAWLFRKTVPRAAQALPSEVLETLGRSPLTQRDHMHLIRLGNKLVLVCISQSGVQPLAEITDPDEVERLSAIASTTQSGSVTETFRDMLTQIGKEPAPPGFLGNAQDDEALSADSDQGGKLHVEV